MDLFFDYLDSSLGSRLFGQAGRSAPEVGLGPTADNLSPLIDPKTNLSLLPGFAFAKVTKAIAVTTRLFESRSSLSLIDCLITDRFG